MWFYKLPESRNTRVERSPLGRVYTFKIVSSLIMKHFEVLKSWSWGQVWSRLKLYHLVSCVLHMINFPETQFLGLWTGAKSQPLFLWQIDKTIGLKTMEKEEDTWKIVIIYSTHCQHYQVANSTSGKTRPITCKLDVKVKRGMGPN